MYGNGAGIGIRSLLLSEESIKILGYVEEALGLITQEMLRLVVEMTSIQSGKTEHWDFVFVVMNNRLSREARGEKDSHSRAHLKRLDYQKQRGLGGQVEQAAGTVPL